MKSKRIYHANIHRKSNEPCSVIRFVARSFYNCIERKTALRWQGIELLNFKYLQKMNKEQKVEGFNVSPAIAKPMLPAVFFWLERHDWGKWEHVMYVEDFRAGIKNFEILRRECKLTGLTQYRRVYVKNCVHGLTSKLSAWWSSQNGR